MVWPARPSVWTDKADRRVMGGERAATGTPSSPTAAGLELLCPLRRKEAHNWPLFHVGGAVGSLLHPSPVVGV